MLADSHIHLDRYPDDDVAGMLRRAAQVGVEQLLTVGVDLESSRKAIELARRHRGIRAAVGIHPTRLAEVADLAAALDGLADLTRSAEVAAIGEVGLDDQAGPRALAAQERFLDGCLDLAAATDLPLVLHVVGAHEAALTILRSRAPVRAVVHYFAGDVALAEQYLQVGCLIGIGKPVARPAQVELRAAARAIPLGRLLLETDTYPLPGRTTEPRDLRLICAAVAELRGMRPTRVAARTTENFERLFGPRSGFKGPRSRGTGPP
jgi:TatD DNase family protein